MAQLMLINPRKRRARKSSSAPKRRRHSVARVASPRSNPRRRTRRNPIAARHMHRIHRRRARRNPIGGGGVGAQIMQGMIGGAGAVLVDVIQGYIPMPASLATGYGPYVVKAGLGVLLGTFGKKILGHTAAKLGAGAITVAAYGAIKTATAGMLPAPAATAAVAGMGYMNPTAMLNGMGEYMTGPGSRMGEYMPDSGQYYAGGGFGNH